MGPNASILWCGCEIIKHTLIDHIGVYHFVIVSINKCHLVNHWQSIVWCTIASIDYKPWWHHQMETFSALLALYAGNSPVTGEFLSQRPMTRCFDVLFDLRLNKQLSKQSWGWWFETPSRSLWRHCNALWTLFLNINWTHEKGAWLIPKQYNIYTENYILIWSKICLN